MLWKWSRSIRIAGEIAPHSHIEDEEEVLIEWIGCPIETCRGDGMVDHIINQEFEQVVFPVEGKYMKLILEIICAAEILCI